MTSNGMTPSEFSIEFELRANNREWNGLQYDYASLQWHPMGVMASQISFGVIKIRQGQICQYFSISCMLDAYGDVSNQEQAWHHSPCSIL